MAATIVLFPLCLLGIVADSIVIARGTNLQGSVGGLLAKATTPVSGAWGHGRLLSTSLVNVLFDDDGRILLDHQHIAPS